MGSTMTMLTIAEEVEVGNTMRGKHDDNKLKLKAPGEREALEPLGVVSIVRDHSSHTTIGRLQRTSFDQV